MLAFWAILCAADVASFAIEIRSVAAAVTINRFSGLLGAAYVLLFSLMIASFLASIALKYQLASSIDNKRRLRVLYAGAAASLLPLSTLFLFERLKGSYRAVHPSVDKHLRLSGPFSSYR